MTDTLNKVIIEFGIVNFGNMTDRAKVESMQKKKKFMGMVLLIIIGYASYAIFSFVTRKYIGHYNYPNGFLFWSRDRFMDFFNVNAMVAERNPYGAFASSYPPLALAFAWLFLFAIYPPAVLMPAWLLSEASGYGDVGKTIMNNLSQGIGTYLIFAGLFTGIILVFLYKIFQKEKAVFKNKSQLYLTILCLTFSAPFIFLLDRGNYLLAAIVCYLFFVYYYDKDEIAASVWLGLASAIKIYPLFMLLIFIVNKKWKALEAAILTMVISSFYGLLLFRGGMFQNLFTLLHALGGFGEGYEKETINVHFGVGLTALIRIPFMIWNEMTVPKEVPVMGIYLVTGLGLTIWTSVHIRREGCAWKKLLVMTALMVFLTPNSYMYNLVYLFPVVVVFCLARGEKRIWIDGSYLLLLGFLMIPKAYYYFIAPYYGVGIQVVLDALLLLGIIFFYNICDTETRRENCASKGGI